MTYRFPIAVELEEVDAVCRWVYENGGKLAVMTNLEIVSVELRITGAFQRFTIEFEDQAKAATFKLLYAASIYPLCTAEELADGSQSSHRLYLSNLVTQNLTNRRYRFRLAWRMFWRGEGLQRVFGSYH